MATELQPLPREAILAGKLERLMKELSLVVEELKATIPQQKHSRPNAQRLIAEFGQQPKQKRRGARQ